MTKIQSWILSAVDALVANGKKEYKYDWDYILRNISFQ